MTNEPNEEIILGFGEFGLEQDQAGNCSGKGCLILKWLPLPAYWFNLETDGDVIKEGTAKLSGLLPQSLSVTVFHPQKTETGFKYHGFLSNDAFDEGLLWIGNPRSRCDVVVFNIINFPLYIIKSETSLENYPLNIKHIDQEGTEWQIVIRPTDNIEDIMLKLDGNAFGGYAITHSGILRKSDGSYFDFGQSMIHLSALRDLLTLIRGGWCYPFFVRGIQNDNDICQSIWEPRVFPWMKRATWANTIEIEQISRIYSSLAKAWLDRSRRIRINNAIGFYVDANYAINAETGIIDGQAALELLSYLFADDSKILAAAYAKKFGKDEFAKLNAEHRIRWMLKEVCNIPTNIPLEAKDILMHYKRCTRKKSYKGVDGPAVITYIRNGIIHPDQEK